MALLIKNGEIVTEKARYFADILIRGEVVSQIGRGLACDDAEVIDATGKYVFPGFIDPHTHVHLPFMGTHASDDYASASRAALVGGTTTIFDMCCPSKNEMPRDAYETWRAKAEGRSACDYSFHMGVTRFDAQAREQLESIAAEGVASLKVFLAYKDAFGVSDEELYGAMNYAKSRGLIVAAHCENETLIAERQRELLAAGCVAPRYHYESRPPFVEAEGVHHLMSFAEATGAHCYIVHLSCGEALAPAMQARADGVNVWIETLIQYLLLDKSHAELPGFEGAKYVMSPPLRDRKNQGLLWDALQAGVIDVVATDHAPFHFANQKTMGAEDFTKIPNGIPSLENRVGMLYTHGVCEGRMSLETFVATASSNAAKIFGLYPRKGTIDEGADADLVVFDPHWRGTVSARTHAMNVDYNVFEGWEAKGRAETVTVRGAVMVRDGAFVGNQSWGKFLAREATHG